MLYEPQEDSFLLAKEVQKHAKGKVFDMGTGTGIQIMNAVKADSRLAVDINPEAIEYCRKRYKGSGIRFIISDLFKNIKGKFDTIIFNPPYLPDDPRLKDMALDGGPKGYELIEKFLNGVNEHLERDGMILLLFSSLSKKDVIDAIIDSLLMESKAVSEEKIDFETLYVYKITKSGLRKELEKKGIRDIHFLARGKRGKAYKGVWRKKDIVIKVERQDIDAVDRIKNEARWLKILNRKSIGPKLYIFSKNYIIMDFVEGTRMKEFVQQASKKRMKEVMKDILNQCFEMDKMKVNKEEMHHPYKHIIVGKKTVMIDFERCRIADSPKNVSQFVQFIRSAGYGDEKLLDLVKDYKKDMSVKNFRKITASL